MNHIRQHHITQAVDALAATASHPAESSTDNELLVSLSDLASISELVSKLVSGYELELARWATVTPHLRQAREQAAVLSRSLNHACGTFAFNTALQPAA